MERAEVEKMIEQFFNPDRQINARQREGRAMENWNDSTPRNESGTAHNGGHVTGEGWQCHNHCPACDQNSGNVCPDCGTPATWGHSHDCPDRPENREEFVPAYTL